MNTNSNFKGGTKNGGRSLSINIAHKISQELSWDKQNELWIQARDKER